jgi:hypothetical protein
MTKSRIFFLSLLVFVLVVLVFSRGNEARQTSIQVQVFGGEIVGMSPVDSGASSVAPPERQNLPPVNGTQDSGLPERTFVAPSDSGQVSQLPELTEKDVAARLQAVGAPSGLSPEVVGVSISGDWITTAGPGR